MTTTIDPELIAIDQFISTIFWADDDITFAEALPAAIDEWTATAAAEHNQSQPFSIDEHDDPLAASLHELLAAVQQLRTGPRTDLTVIRAISEAFADWGQDL